MSRSFLLRALRPVLVAGSLLLCPALAARAMAAPALSAGKSVADDNGGSPRPSEVLTYTITITSTGTTAATNVLFSDPLPAGTTYLPGSLASDDPADVIVEGDPLQVQVGSLPAPGGGDNDVVITFKVQIGAGAAGGTVISNQATVTADGPLSQVSDDPSTGAPDDATSVTVVNPLDIALAKSASLANANPGQNIVYTLSYSNAGSVDATNVTISDFVPADTAFVSATAGGTLSGGVVDWSIGTILAGGSGSVQFTVQVNAGVAAGTIVSNSATISFQDDLGNTQDPESSNTVSTTVNQGASVSAQPDQSGGIRVPPGSTSTYTFTVTNTGNGTDRFDLTPFSTASPFSLLVELIDGAGTVVATDTTPGDGVWDTVLPAADTDGDGNPDTGNLAAGATLTYQLRITKSAGGCNGCVDITGVQATSNFDGAVSDTVTFTTTVQNNSAILSVTKSDSPDPVAAGSNITYTIVATNSGTGALSNVLVTDPVPPDTTFVSASAPGTLAGGTVTWSFASLASGSSETLTLTVQVNAGVPNGTVISNTVTSGSTETTPVQAVATTAVQSPVSFATSTKTVNFANATPGSTLTYTISVVNSGSSGATEVVVTDTIPADTTYVAGSITGAGADDSGSPNLVWNVGNVAGGASANLTYQVRVNNPAPAGTTSVTNTASIDSDQTLPVDTTTATTNITASPNFTLSTKSVSDLNGGLVTTGDTLRYTIVVRNSGNMNATGVVVTDAAPADTTYVAGSITGAGADDSGAPSLVWSIGALNGGGATTTLTFDARIAEATPDGTLISNVGSVDSDQTVPVNTSTASSTVQAGYTGTLTSTPTINPGNAVSLTLTDRNLNADPAAIDTLSLTTVNSVTGESETLTYTETGADTGVFTASVATSFGTTAGANDDGTFNVQAGDTLVTNYSDVFTATGGSATVTATTNVVSSGVSGTITATATILPGQAIAITVIDADLNSNPAAAETATVTVTNPATGESETVTLTETGVNTGIFTGTLATSEGSVPDPTAGVLAVAKDDVVTSAYTDAISGTGGPATVTAATTVVKPVLAISKADSPEPVQAGSNLTYTISYSNTGTAGATNVVVTDTLPASTSFVSATGGGTEAGGIVTWNIGGLAAGGSGSVDLVVQVASPLPNGTVIDNATYSIDSTETAPVAGASVTTTVSSAPVLSIGKTDAPDPVAAGSNITYAISYSNTGNENATGVVIADTVPANTTFVSATGGGTEAGGVVTWNIGALAAGASGSVQLVVQVASPLPNGTLISNSTYSIDCNETAPVSGAAVTTTVGSAPSLNVSKTDAPDPVSAGSNITYAISYSNTGNANASGVVITDTIPVNTSFVSATGGGSLAGGVVTWNIGALNVGASGSVQLVVQVANPLANGTAITNGSYSIDCNETAAVSGAAVTTTVTSAPVLAISKTDSPDPVVAGSNLTYTLSYSNAGNENASSVVITDTVPANTSFVSATGGGSEAGGIVTWNIGGLAAGGSGSVDLVVQVASPLPNGTVIDNATYSIDSTETAPVAGASVTTTVSSAPVLEVSKTDAPDPVAAGSNITYAISYSNTGNENATGVVIADTVPANTTFVSATGGGTEAGGVVTWNIGALNAGASGSVQLVVQVVSPLPNGTLITNDTYSIDSNETGASAGAAQTTTVGSAPSLNVSKTDAPDPVSAGSNITYTVTYSNSGNANATGVVITDTVPANTSFVSATGGGTLAGGVVTWNIGALNAGASASVQLVVQTASPLPNGTLITNGAYSIDCNETAPVSGAAVTTTVSSAPVLSVSKTDAPDPVAAGSNLTYTISYSNTGNEDASGVVIGDTVPANTTFVSATGGGTEAGGIVTWNIGALNAGASGSVQLVVQTASPLPNGTLISNSTYSIDSNETAPVSGAAVTTTVTSAPVLSVGKTDAPDPVNAGSNITYTISYSNTGNANASGVVLADTVPANTSFVSATGGGGLAGGVVTWNIGALAAGASGSVQLVVQVASPLPNGTLISNSTYSIDSNETAPVSGAAVTTTVSSSPVLNISKTDAPDPVSAGSNITYTISYSNTGNANASGVVITDSIPANTSFVSATGGGSLAGGVVTWSIGALNAGSAGSVQLVVQTASPLPNGTLISNSTYGIDSNETAPVSGALVTTAVTSAPVLAISKTDAPDPVAAGSNITYTISYSNTGNANATGTVISDTVPADTTFVSATGGGTLAGGVVTWNLGILAAGASSSVQLVVQVASPLPNGTLISNSTYSIDSNETAPVAGAAVTTTVTSAPVLAISKTDSPDPVAAGNNITYTISYSNGGNENATGVVITDTVPANTTFVSATGGGALAGGLVTWNVGALAAGGSGSAQLVVQVASPLPDGTVITNGAYDIDSNETATVSGAAAATTVTSDPILSIAKTDAPDPAVAGADNITYTLSYSNAGNADATGVAIADTVPAGTTFVSATGGGVLAGGVVTWNVGALPAGASGSVQMVVSIDTPVTNGATITNGTYSIDCNETAAVAGASVTTTVLSSVRFTIGKSDAPDPVAAGSDITYTLSYQNTGTQNATGVVLTDPLPASTTFVSATGGGALAGGVVTWNIGNLAAGAAGSVQLVVRVASPLANGTVITNTGWAIDSSESLPQSGPDATTTVTSAPVLAVSKTDSPDPVAAGSDITYTISYSNAGNENATGAVLTDAVPANTTFVSASGGGTEAGGVVTWNIGALSAGSSGSRTLVVRVNTPLPDGTLISNDTYQIDSSETAPVAGAGVTTTVSSSPVLSVSKTDSPDPVNAGSNITYTISYSNTGTANATGVVIADTVPANTTFVSATGGGAFAAGVVTWNLGNLPAGASGSLQLVVQVVTPLANGTLITNGSYSIDSNETAAVNGAAVTTTVSSVPVLSVTKAAAPDPVAAGANLTYTLSYSNSGTSNATGVVLRDTLPADTAFVSATGGGALAGGVVTWNLGALAAGGSGSVTLVVQVASPLANGSAITNATYSIDSNETAPAAGPPVSVTVTSSPSLTATKAFADDNGGVLAPGDTVTYTITVTNSGNGLATGVSLSDAIPADTTLVAGSLASDDPTDALAEGNPLTVAIGTLGSDPNVVITFRVRLASPLASGTLIANQATVTANGGINIVSDDPSTGAPNDATSHSVTSAPSLTATKTAVDDNGGALIEGETVTYTITVTNSGDADATAVSLSDAIPADATLVAGSLTSDDATDVRVEGNPLTVTIGTLSGVGGADSDVVITFRVLLDTPLAGGTIVSNQASVTAAGGINVASDDPSTVAPNDPTRLTVSAAAANLVMTQTVSDLNGGSLNPGDTLLYTITLANTGTVAATTVAVQDPIPASTALVAGSLASDDPTDVVTEGNPLSVQVGTLFAPGGGDSDVVITYRVVVDPATPSGIVISNQASMTADGPLSGISDDPAVNDGSETGNDPADPGDDDPTLSAPVFLGDILQVAIGADVTTVRRGDFILYTVTLTNPTALPVNNVSLQDRLPVGASLVRGTLTLDGAAQADPAGSAPLVIPVGTLNPGQTRTLVYRAVANGGALLGDLENEVVAVDSASQRLSAPASVRVSLLEDPEFDLATIIGKVFDDRDGDGVQDAGEEGIGGAMVAMEDGVYALTDGNGMYHIAAVRPGNRLVKINRHTLPPNDGLTLPEAQTLTVTPGVLAKVNFGVRRKATRTTWPGIPGTYGIAVAEEKVEAQAEVVGNLDDMTAVVNGVQARLPRTRVKMDVMSLERNLKIVNGELEKPAVFDLAYPRDRSVKEWTFEIFDSQMRRIRGFRGRDLKRTQIVWDGRDARGSVVQGGAIYQYQLTIEFRDGSLSKTPVRLFGVNRTNAISFELTGASFETNTSILNESAMSILSEVASTLRKYPDEKVVIRGHTDATGTPDWNARLSLLRAEAVQAYLTAAGIAPERLMVEGRGAEEPVAPNDTEAGRARNRRVEIKALLQETDYGRAYASTAAGGRREVVVNGQNVPVDEDGSFRAVVDSARDRGRVYVGLRTEDGGVSATTVTLPTVVILEPATNQKIEIGQREDVIRLMQPQPTPDGPRYPSIRIPVRGRTEPGNQVFIDGEPVEVLPDGQFLTGLPLAVGGNTFGVVAIAPNGHTSLLNLSVDLTGVDKKYDVITVRKPVPQFTLDLPPRGAVLSSPNLFVSGRVPPKASVRINSLRLGVRPDGTFGGTVRLPEGPSFLEAVVTMPEGQDIRTGVPVTVKTNFFFLAALGDATVNRISTEGEVPDGLSDDLYVDGRVALYLKGRIQGKYLISAGMDSGDGRLSEIGSRLGDRDNRSLFRELDPDAFYPVYGDSSRTFTDANSQGRFYVLFEAPSSTFQWGNYHSGITGNELSSFNRSLYGGKGTWRSLRKGKSGEPLGEAIVFAALPETRSAHDEFTGTGGSLYFLRNKKVVPGSEKVRLEVRDKISGIPLANLTRGNHIDYEIDYAEGRILFRSPVSSVADSSTLISDGLLNGNPAFVVVDYEYETATLEALDETTYGGRVKRVLGDSVTLGATYVQEDRAGTTYTLQGGDISVRAGAGTEVKAEFSQSQNEAVPQFVSDDGGLTFTPKSVPASDDSAQAYRFEFGTGQGPVRFTGYLRHIDAGFSSSFSAGENEVDQVGGSASVKMGGSGAVDFLFDSREAAGVSTVRTATLQMRQTFGKLGVALEARLRDTDNALGADTSEGIGALRLELRVTPKLKLFTRYQTDFLQEVDGASVGTGSKRQATLGVDAQVTPRLGARAELTSGEQGDSALVGVHSKLDERTLLYGTYTMSPDQAGARTGVATVGATSAVGERTRLYTEEQFKRNERESATTNVVGLRTKISERLAAGVSFERTRADGSGALPDALRQAASASLSFVAARFKAFSKFELRQDEGSGLDRDQWVSTNALELRLTRDLTLLGRFNYGVTTDNLTDEDESVFRERGLGVALRPVAVDWIHILARYTEIQNLPPASQTSLRDRTNDRIFSFQTVVDLHRRLRLTEKYAVRDRELDPELLADLQSRMKLWINRFDYRLSDTWDAALEYRDLATEEASETSRDGFLFEVNRLLFDHLRLGVGYNFTDFTDSIYSVNDYSARGVFFRIQGKY